MATENNSTLPLHVSIIMDGNGRWAKERGKERVYGHFEGVSSVRACVEASVETGVKYLSLFAFSEENWNRPGSEVSTLMGLMVKAMADEMDSLDKNGVRFVVLGNRERLDASLNETIDACMERTKNNETLTLVIFLSYSGKWDIHQAAKKMAQDILDHPERREEIMTSGVDAFDKNQALPYSQKENPLPNLRLSPQVALSRYASQQDRRFSQQAPLVRA